MPPRSPTIITYQNDKVVGIISTSENRRAFQGNNIALAEIHSNEVTKPLLLTSDLNGSILETISSNSRESHAYTAYGFNNNLPSPNTLFGFNGEVVDLSRSAYLLGSYRMYNPALKRFHSPDDLSPFEAGGLNSYCYVNGDPINNIDPSGHSLIKGLKNVFGRQRNKIARINTYNNKVQKYNEIARALELFDPVYTEIDGSTNIGALYANQKRIKNFDLLPDRSSLSKKDRIYAKKHELPITGHVEDPKKNRYLKKSQKLISENIEALDEIRQDQTPAMAANGVRRTDSNKSTSRSYWYGNKVRDKFGYNPDV